ncbi:AraC family transcriptional regulator [Klebsiella variicola]|uniref:AraC family transcriptional regulator n=1 Tax=Klebsiella variicola TaxID=244366 RepID=A0A7H4MIX1_KLEVA|nr:AraC family transcriptional regulator [Klebsiella variicola]
MLRRDFMQPVSVDALADAAGMSVSVFHRHFRAMTTLSPLQFQKQLRLIHARRLMLAEGMSIAQAAGEVAISACRSSPGNTLACMARRRAAIVDGKK